MTMVILGMSLLVGAALDWGATLGLSQIDQDMLWAPLREYVNNVIIGWQSLLT